MIFRSSNPRRLRLNIYVSVLFLLLGYEAINAFVPNADMILSTRVLALGFYTAVMYVYLPDAWRALIAPVPKRSDFLVIGIWVSFLGHLLQTLYSILYRLAPSSWLLNSEIVSPLVMCSCIAAVLHISAPEALDGTVPRRNRIALGIGVGCATLLVGMLLVTRPNIRPYVDEMQPWIGDWFKTGMGNIGLRTS